MLEEMEKEKRRLLERERGMNLVKWEVRRVYEMLIWIKSSSSCLLLG